MPPLFLHVSAEAWAKLTAKSIWQNKTNLELTNSPAATPRFIEGKRIEFVRLLSSIAHGYQNEERRGLPINNGILSSRGGRTTIFSPT